MESKELQKQLLQLFPQDQVFTDEIHRLVKGTDAGLYRLLPKAVVKVNSEEEVIRLIRFCRSGNIPVTFKAAGTSLSGQTISDSILMETGNGFEFSTITACLHQFRKNRRNYCKQRKRVKLRHPA